MPYISGLYTGLEYHVALIDNDEQVESLDNLLELYVRANKQDSIVSIFVMPSVFYTSETKPVTKELDIEIPSKIDGYTPRNKKLLTYPYCFLTIDCLNDCKNYRYEFSEDKEVMHFAILGNVSPNVEILLCPRQYNGTKNEVEGSHGTVNVTEELIMTGFPQCAFSIDSYRAWLAQKANGAIISGGASLGLGVASALSGNVVGAVGSGLGLMNTINNAIIEATKGSTARGSQGGGALVAFRSKDFYIKRMSITKEYAKMIDDFFDRYGYTVNRLKKPHRHARKNWTYVKTRDCCALGSVPSDDLKKINEIYDKGITFWSSASKVGDYSNPEQNTIVPSDSNWY